MFTTQQVMSPKGLTFEKLHKNNYPAWKVRASAKLLAEGVMTLGDKGMIFKNDAKGFSLIVDMIQEDFYHLLDPDMNTEKSWNNIIKAFEDVSLVERTRLSKELFTRRIGRKESIEEHVRQLKLLRNRLNNCENATKLTDDDLIPILLSSLEDHPHFKAAVGAVKMQKIEDFTLEELTKRFTAFERIDEKNDERAYYAKGKHSKERKQIQCYKCKKYGHYQRNCPKNGNDNEKHQHENTRMEGNKAFCWNITGNFVSHDTLVLDSGASQHFTGQKDILENFEEVEPTPVYGIGGAVAHIMGQGCLRVLVSTNNKQNEVILSDVKFVPGMKQTLVSVGKLIAKGVKVDFNERKLKVGKEVVADIIANENNIFSIKTVNQEAFSAIANDDPWHEKFAHANKEKVEAVVKKFNLPGQVHKNDCVACGEAKTTRDSFPTSRNEPEKEQLGLIHSDVCGPFPEESLGGSKYYAVFIDDYSSYTALFPMKRKSDLLSVFEEYHDTVTATFKKPIRRFRSDNGGEFTSESFKEYLKQKGIKQELTVPYNPEQNGTSERKIRTINDTIRVLIKQSGFTKNLWAEAAITACFVWNRLPRSRDGQIPYFLWSGRDWTGYASMRTFGDYGFVHIPKQKRENKLADHGELCRFVGYDDNRKAYRMITREGKIIVSCSVKWTKHKIAQHMTTFTDMENSESLGPVSHSEREENRECKTPEPEEKTEDLPANHYQTPKVKKGEVLIPIAEEKHYLEKKKFTVDTTLGRTRSATHTQENINYALKAMESSELLEPNHYKDVMNSPDRSKWEDAIRQEFDSFVKNKVFELAVLPPGKNVVGSRYVFKIKRNEDGTIKKFKARIVARGFTQRYGIDYKETFAPVVNFNSVRLLLTIAATDDLDLYHLDTKSAFLMAPLEEEIYMKLPEGFDKMLGNKYSEFVKENPGKNIVMKLKRSVYGLKNASRNWNVLLDSEIKALGFQQNEKDPCVYSKGNNHIGVYVDDQLLATKDKDILKKVNERFGQIFKMNASEELNWYLNVHIERDRSQKEIYLSQKLAVGKLLENFEDLRPASTPMINSEIKDENPDVDATKYRSTVGSLIYIMAGTRPDIAFAVSHVSRSLQNPKKRDWENVIRILRYLKGTKNYGLVLGGENSSNEIIGMADASWGNSEDRKSIGGYALFFRNSLIGWKSKKQATVALSTTESELIATSSLLQEYLWTKQFLKELGLDLGVGTIYNDNNGCVMLIESPRKDSRTKHSDIKLKFLHDNIQKENCVIKYISTEEMVADIFTKPLSRMKFNKFRSQLRVRNLERVLKVG